MNFPIFKLENQHTRALIDPKSGEFALGLTEGSEPILGCGFILNRLPSVGFEEPKIELILANPIIPLASEMVFETVYGIDK